MAKGKGTRTVKKSAITGRFVSRPAKIFSGKSPAKADGQISSSGSLKMRFSSSPRPRQTTG